MPVIERTTFDQTEFRTVMGHFPTGVVVVASESNGIKSALTLQSFQSLSLEPALILVSVAKTSTSWPSIAANGTFAVTYLSADQGPLARQFSRQDGGDKFEGVELSETPVHKQPLLSGGSAWVECELDAVHDGGDHHIVVARVVSLGLLKKSTEPIVFFSSKFAELNAAV